MFMTNVMVQDVHREEINQQNVWENSWQKDVYFVGVVSEQTDVCHLCSFIKERYVVEVDLCIFLIKDILRRNANEINYVWCILYVPCLR